MTSPSRAGIAVALGSFLFVVAIGASHGGYFPTAWGWCVLGFAWIAALALLLGGPLRPGRLEVAFLTALSLLIGWIALSITWSDDVGQTVLEVQRAIVYLMGAFAAVLAVRRRHVPHLLGGLLGGIVWLAVQALGSRLFPASGPAAEQIDVGRLADPLGYFNALGLFAVMGALLAFAFAARARTLPARAAAAATLPVLLTAAYFTYSRGAALALAVGLVGAVALDRRRLEFLTSCLLVALPAALAVWLASRAPGLTSISASRSVVEDEGRQLAIVLLGLMAASAAVGVALGSVGRRIRIPPGARRGYALALGCVAVAAVIAGVVNQGGPSSLARSAYDAVGTASDPTAADANNLNRRLGSISSTQRVEHWRVARQVFEQHPWIGSGAGTFEQHWLQQRPTAFQARDAHSLYLESLAELGVVGLLLVLGLLALPLAGALRAREHPLVAGAFGAYLAYLVHAGIDWHWEMPVVTLLAVACGVGLITVHDEGRAPRQAIASGWRLAGMVAIAALTTFSLVGLAGNRALADATRAVDAGEVREGEAHARTAVRWAPWSAEAQAQLGRAQAASGRRAQGRASLLEAARMNPNDWRIWYDLGVASSGRERVQAFAEAARLNPLEGDIEVLREQGYELPRPGAPR